MRPSGPAGTRRSGRASTRAARRPRPAARAHLRPRPRVRPGPWPCRAGLVGRLTVRTGLGFPRRSGPARWVREGLGESMLRTPCATLKPTGEALGLSAMLIPPRAEAEPTHQDPAPAAFSTPSRPASRYQISYRSAERIRTRTADRCPGACAPIRPVRTQTRSGIAFLTAALHVRAEPPRATTRFCS